MAWRGKMIGGSIGSFFGPWGALAGAAVGHAFVDRKQAAAAERQALHLLAVTAAALYELAGVDGRYTPREDRAIRTILADLNLRFGTRLPAHELAYLIDDSSRLDQSLSRLAGASRADLNLGRAAATWLWRVAVSDGEPVPAETDRIMAFARHAGLSEEEARGASLLFVRTGGAGASDQARRDACHTLGVPYNADAPALKLAYRSLSLKYHPDRHAALDPDIRALTAEKFAQIKAAYDTLAGGAPQTPGDWWVRRADSGRLTPAAEAAHAAVACLACGRQAALPGPDALAAARCDACQALLALDRALAEQLA